jgi:DNA polymerase (family 10)
VELDIEAILEGLEVTGVALEINGALDRLDASAEVARQAMARDINLVIDTDSHHTKDLVRMDYGVEYARRGWVTSDRVVNTWDVDRLLSWADRRHP